MADCLPFNRGLSAVEPPDGLVNAWQQGLKISTLGFELRTVRRSPPDGPVVQNQPFSGRRKQPRIHQNFTKTGPKLIQTSRKFAWVFLDLSQS